MLSPLATPTLNVWIRLFGGGHGQAYDIKNKILSIPNILHVSWRNPPGIFIDNIDMHGINLIILDVTYFQPCDGPASESHCLEVGEFIDYVRIKCPRICFILWFESGASRDEFLSAHPGRFDHYLYVLSNSSKRKYSKVILQAGAWLQIQYDYDLAVSFAGEDRPLVEEIQDILSGRGVRVFYDMNAQHDLIGRDLYQYLQSVYKTKSRYIAVFISRNYVRKPWPSHELKQAQARAFVEDGYILPIRLDDTEVPGLNETTAYLDAKTLTSAEICDVLFRKLFYSRVTPSSPE